MGLKHLTEDQVAAYARDGFLSPVTVMSEEEAAAYRARFEAAEAQWGAALDGRNRMNAHLILPVLDELAHHPAILNAVEDLLGPDFLLNGSVLFIKEAGDPGFVSWHQDARYVGLEPYTQATTVWLALSPSTPETGCMRMAPGTHLGPLRAHADTYGAENILTRGQTIEGVDEASAVDLPLKPGQMSFHHLGVAHCSQPNRGADRRIGFVLQSFVTPEVRSTLGPVSAQLSRGADPNGHMTRIPRPSGEMTPDGLALRDRVNAEWADVLYAGADRRRDL